MDFTIYSMGDPSFIRLALLGLSHAFEQGALSLAKIGLLLGLLFVFWQGIWNPGKIEFKQFFIGFFLVLLLFGKNVQVTLIHSNGLSADAIPPIPIGIAVGASIATNFGYSLATTLRDFYQTAYTPGQAATGTYISMMVNDPNMPTISVAGSGLEPLRELMKLRFDGNMDATLSSTSYNQSNNQNANGNDNVDVSQSLLNYMRDCVLKDIYNGPPVQEVNEAYMATASNAWLGMKMSYDGWVTTVNLINGQGWKQVGCGQAYSQLSTSINSHWKAIIENEGSATGNLQVDLASVGKAMVGSTSAEAFGIKANQMLLYHFKKAKTMDRWASKAELQSSNAEFEALDKRRVSTAVQYSLWSEMAVPLITFIESFVYLIGPLMPFVVAFGEKGMGMMIKYFLMLIWVNTWPVLQVGVNMYLQNYINQASFATAPYDPFSWAGYNTTFTEVESFISMGSTLQTMVPALSLMILYGSVHTAINLSNGAQKGGGSEGANATPKIAAAADGGKTSVGATSYTHDSFSGGTTTAYTGAGAANIGMTQFNTKNDASAASSRTATVAREKAASAEVAQGVALTSMANETHNAGLEMSSGSTSNATLSEGATKSAMYAKTFSKIEGLSQESADTLGMITAMGVSVDAVMGFDAKAGLDLSVPTGADTDDAGGKGPGGKGPGDKGPKGKAKASLAVAGGVKAKATIGSDAKVAKALTELASIKEASGDSWGETENKVTNSLYSDANTFSKMDKTGMSTGWGQSGQDYKAASRKWSENTKIANAESLVNSSTSGISGGNGFNLNSVTSLADQNKADEKLSDGTILAESMNGTAMESLSPKESQDFANFKAQGVEQGKWAANGTDGNIKALQAFSQTKEGESLQGLMPVLKTSTENAEEASSFVKGDVGETPTLQARNESLGRYADSKFKDILNNTSTDHRYDAAANFLDATNDATGGKMANLSTASRDLRTLGGVADKALKEPDIAPPAGLTEEKVKSNYDAFEGKAKNAVEAKKMDPATEKAKLKEDQNKNNQTVENVPDNKELAGKRNDLSAKANNKLEANKTELDKVKPALETVKRISDKGLELGNKLFADSESDKATSNLSEQAGVSPKAAALITQGEKGNAHSNIVNTLKNGFKEDATPEQRKDAIEVVAASMAAKEEIKTLENGSPEQQALAKEMQANVNSVDAALSASNTDNPNVNREANKSLIAGLAEKVKNNEITSTQATAAFRMSQDDSYRPTNARSSSDTSGRSGAQYNSVSGSIPGPKPDDFKAVNYDGVVNNIKGGEAAMKVLENNGLENSEQYRSLSEKVGDSKEFLKDNVKENAAAIASRAFNEDPQSDVTGNRILKEAMGNKGTSLDSANLKNIMTGKDDKEQGLIDKIFEPQEATQTGALDRYETVRGGLIKAADALHGKEGMQEYENNIRATVGRLDEQTQYSSRLSNGDESGKGPAAIQPVNIPQVNYSKESFDNLQALDDGQKTNIDGQTYTKNGGGTDRSDGTSVVSLTNDKTNASLEIKEFSNSIPSITTNSGGDQPVASGGGNQPVASGGGNQPVASGGGNQPIASGGGNQPVASGGGNQPVASGGGNQPVASGGGNQPVASVSQLSFTEQDFSDLKNIDDGGQVLVNGEQHTKTSQGVDQNGQEVISLVNNNTNQSMDIPSPTNGSGTTAPAIQSFSGQSINDPSTGTERLKITPDELGQISQVENGKQVNIGNETYTKNGGGTNGDLTSVQLTDSSGQMQSLYDNKNGFSNLTLEKNG